MLMSLQDAARALPAELFGVDRTFSSVSTDSRAVSGAALFVALRGERLDGHHFVTDAIKAGAVAALVEHGSPAWGDFPILRVPDSRCALGRLAACWRSRFDLPVVGITGSSGKTTVKEMLAAILAVRFGAENVLATQGNLNNDIGLPHTLFGLAERHRVAVIEMGMNHPGEIAVLTKIARPTVALITNAQAAHLEGLGSVANVAAAKGEIFDGLPPSGIAVINADDPHAPLWERLAGKRQIVRYGLSKSCAVSATFLPAPFESVMAITTPEGRFDVTLPVPGEHNVRNALAAAAVATALGLCNAEIARGLSEFSGVRGRLQKKPGLHGALLIDDTYNANPGSVRAAVDVLARMPGTKVLVLGDMGELGEAGAVLHREMGAVAKAAGIDRLLALGRLSAASVAAFGQGGRHFEQVEGLLCEVENLLAPGVTVLVKGSRFMQMERVVEAMREMTCCSH